MLPLAPFLIPLVALALSLVLFGGFVGLAGADVQAVYQSIYRGAFGTWFSWQNTLTSAAPLMLTALCTALPARLGLIVIGGEGAVVVGGLAAALTGLVLVDANPWVALSGMALAAMLTGGLLIGLVGWLRHSRNVNETISSLLFNYISIAILSFLVIGPLRDPETLNKPSTHHIGEDHMLGVLGDTSIHWGFGYGLIVCLLLWVLYKRTVFGFAVDMVGGNVRAALLSGLPVGRIVFMVCMMGGAAAGLAGMVEVAAVHGRANTSLNAGYGYEGILIAFAARHHPLAIIPMAILFGGIRASSGLMQRDHDLPDATSLVLQGIIFILILASEAVFARLAKRQGSAA
ncbi:ABC transporter permease [Thiobacillus sp.]|uniref:ABC transporter permease n=1 Tax=Thiobacillus sp. TaxID=924 RepID=UPI00286E7F4C|nr:ABC transporter permease [Thiobacillus sp.]